MSDSDLQRAIELALNNNWDESHRIVQGIDNPRAAWIHAVLHKIEGDRDNAAYWYNKAQMTFSEDEPRAELRRILTTLK